MSVELKTLPYGRQEVDEADIAAVIAVLRGDWLTTGPAVDAFEGALAQRLDVPHVIACSSGTAGLHLAMLALDLQPGDAVIVPAVTFLATANAVRYTGAEVIFADVDPSTGLMGIAELQAAVERGRHSRIRAVVPVHYAGQCIDPVALNEAVRSQDIVIVDDAAHAVGATYQSVSQEIPVGSGRHSAMSVFSFHPVKTITTAEGGAVSTANDRLATRLRRLRSHGINRGDVEGFSNVRLATDRQGRSNPWYYEMTELGFNYRLTDVQCALGYSQLKRLDRFIARRRELVARYDRLLAPFSPTIQPLGRTHSGQPSWHLYVVRIDFSELNLDRAALMASLAADGISTQVHYIPVHLQPYYRRRDAELRLPGAEAFYEQALSLPLFPAMSDTDVERVVTALIKHARMAQQ